MQRKLYSGMLLAAFLVAPAMLPAADEKPRDEGFTTIFDGKTLDGWHVSSKTGHGSGGRWVVEDGAIVGSQDKPGNGGIIITDKAYGDFEVMMIPLHGPDKSGHYERVGRMLGFGKPMPAP